MKSFCHRHGAALALGVLLASTAILAPGHVRADVATDGAQTGLSIVESGPDAAHRVYTIQADGVDVAEVLRAFFKKAGQEVAIDRDVTGPVRLTVRDRSFRDALQWIVQAARPFIKITALNGVYHVSRDAAAQAAEDARQRADAVRNAMAHGVPPVVPLPGGPGGIAPMAGPRLGSMSPLWSAGVPNDRPVSISVPPNRPIPLAEAIARLSAQARFPISLDPQVPRDLSFTGIITDAPLPLVLQTIASTSGLKLIANGRQAVFYPTDQFRILVNNVLLNQYQAASVPCAHCGQMVSPAWSFCPFCGQPTPHGVQPGRGAPGAAPTGGQTYERHRP